MIRLLPKILIQAFVLLLLQVAVVNNINLGTLNITPHFYVLFFLLLPFETPAWIMLFIGFFFGLSIDLFSDTNGLHAASSVVLVFVRAIVLKGLAPRDGYETGQIPRLHYFGLEWFAKYAAILIVLHHTVFYLLEAFSFDFFFRTFVIILLSSLVSIVLVLLSQYFMFRN